SLWHGHFPPLDCLRAIRKVLLSDVRALTALPPSVSCVGLKKLKLVKFPQLEDISQLPRDLGELTLCNLPELKNIDPLANIATLPTLTIRNCPIVSVSVLSACSRLQYLTLDHPCLSSFDGIERCPSLEVLKINNGSSLLDMTPVTRSVSLRVI